MAQQQLALDIAKKFHELVYPYARGRDPFSVSHGTRGKVSAVLEPKELHPGDAIHVKAGRFAVTDSNEVSAMQAVSLQLLNHLETQGILPDDWWRWPADWQAAREPGVIRFYLVCTLLSIRDGYYTPRKNITSYHISSSYQTLADDILDDLIHEGSVTQNSKQQVRLASVDEYNHRQQQHTQTYTTSQQQQPSYGLHQTSIQPTTRGYQHPAASYSRQEQQTTHSYLDRLQTGQYHQQQSAVGAFDMQSGWPEARQVDAAAPATVKPAASPTGISTGYAADAYGSYSGAANRPVVATTGGKYRSTSPPQGYSTAVGNMAAASYQQPAPSSYHQQQRRHPDYLSEQAAAHMYSTNSAYQGQQQPLQPQKPRAHERAEPPPATDRHYTQQQLARSLQKTREQQYGQPDARHVQQQQQQQQSPPSRWTQDRAAAAAAAAVAAAAGRSSTAARHRAGAQPDRDCRPPPPALVGRSISTPSHPSPSRPAAQHSGSRHTGPGGSAGRDRDPPLSPRLRGDLPVSPRSRRAAGEALPRTRDRSASRYDQPPRKRPHHHHSPARRERSAADHDRDRGRDRPDHAGVGPGRRPQEADRARDKGPLRSSSSPASGRHNSRDRPSCARDTESSRDRPRDRSAVGSSRGARAVEGSSGGDRRRGRSPRQEGDRGAAGSDKGWQRDRRTADRPSEVAGSSRDRGRDKDRDTSRDRSRDRHSKPQSSRRDKDESSRSDRDRSIKSNSIDERIRQVFAAGRVDRTVEPGNKDTRTNRTERPQQQQQEHREQQRHGSERQERIRGHMEQQQQQQKQQPQVPQQVPWASAARGGAVEVGSDSAAATAGGSSKLAGFTHVQTNQQYAAAAIQLILAAAPFAVDLGPLKFQLAAAGRRLGIPDNSIDTLVQMLVREGLFEVFLGDDKYNQGMQYVRAVTSCWSPAVAQQLGRGSADDSKIGAEGPAGDVQMGTTSDAAASPDATGATAAGEPLPSSAAARGDGTMVGAAVLAECPNEVLIAAADVAAAAAAGCPNESVRLEAAAADKFEHGRHITEDLVVARAALPQDVRPATATTAAATAEGYSAGHTAGDERDEEDDGNEEELPDTDPASPLVGSAVDVSDGPAKAAAGAATLAKAAAESASQNVGGAREVANAAPGSAVVQLASAGPPVLAAAPATMVAVVPGTVTVANHVAGNAHVALVPAAPAAAGLYSVVPTLDLRPVATALTPVPVQESTADPAAAAAGTSAAGEVAGSNGMIDVGNAAADAAAAVME